MKDLELPSTFIIPYLPLKDLCQARLASRQFYEQSKQFFSPEKHLAILYEKFIRGVTGRKLANSVILLNYVEFQIVVAPICTSLL